MRIRPASRLRGRVCVPGDKSISHRAAIVAGLAPLGVEGRWPLEAIRYEMPVASAQVKSCVLLAGLGARGHTQVVEPHGQTRDHTERMLAWFGADVATDWPRTPVPSPSGRPVVVTLEGPTLLRARDVSVPGDFSSAAFLFAAAAMLRGSDLQLDGILLNPTRAHLLRLLMSLRADLKVEFAGEECGEPVGSIRVRGTRELVPDPESFPAVAGRGPGGETGSNVVRGHAVAQMIDELPVLAVLPTQVRGGPWDSGAGGAGG